jgi:hypothetical protein
MSDTVKWSFSTDRCFRRCQRQYFLQHVAAWHSTRDTLRKRAFLAKQVKTLELWLGSLVHRGIELYVVPAWQERRVISWEEVVAATSAMAKRQLAFSAAGKYRETGMSKSKAEDDYCALAGHETSAGVTEAEFQSVLLNIERSFANLATMSDLLDEIVKAGKLWPELTLYLNYDIARIEVRMDLLYFRGYGKPTIVDWKVSESLGGSDADLQTALYAWALCRHPTWRVTEAAECELIEVQLLNNTMIRHRAAEEVFERLENRIYRSADMIYSLQRGQKYDLSDLSNYEFAANPNSCSFCTQRSLCQELAADDSLADGAVVEPIRRKKERNNEPAYPQLF